MAGKKQEVSTNRYIVVITLISVAIVLISGYIGYNLLGQIVLNTKVVIGKTKAKNDLEEKLKNAPILIENYEKLGSQRDLINHALPTRADFPALNSIMENESNVAGVKLLEITPESFSGQSTSATTANGASSSSSTASTNQNPDKPISYLFSVQVEGPYARVVELAKQIELSARPMRLTSMKLSGSSGDLVAELQITTYYQGKADISDKKEPVK